VASARIWISYDLGVQGDYEGLYAWLDHHEAKECGDTLAFLSYRYKDDLIEELKGDLSEAVRTDKRTRIYVIYRDADTTRARGKFIFGGRRAATWVGYAQSGSAPDDE
jgi:hypothetical protein